MKGSLLWKLMYIFCALAGLLAGYGIFTLTGQKEIEPNEITKDNTLLREAGDSVFFDKEEEVIKESELPEESPTVEIPSPTVEPPKSTMPSVTPEPAEPVNVLPKEPEPPEITPAPVETIRTPADLMPSLASQWVLHEAPELPPAPVSSATASEQVEKVETITYPAKIFGQVPVINRSDAYVSYFEFAYDLIAMLEPEVERRGLNMNSLLTKFALKALFCGVDIEKLDINAPIPRRLAALCLWLAAQVLGEGGSETSAKSARKYVTDIEGCSSSEKKAVAYLYEQGILKGYQVPGQSFYPDAGLQTESGTVWLSRVKQCWK